jgi:tetratricopeptide (TPR) repeat protein
LYLHARKVIQLAKELFAATLEDNAVALVLARAKLRAICTSPASADRKLWKLTSWFYLGLHYDALGSIEESKDCLKQALRLCPNAKGDDIIQALPMMHMSIRDWFDDDDFSEDDANQQQAPSTPSQVVAASIQQSVKDMKLNQLQDALKLRGLKFHGLKEDLQRKLVASLCADLGLAPDVEQEEEQ